MINSETETNDQQIENRGYNGGDGRLDLGRYFFRRKLIFRRKFSSNLLFKSLVSLQFPNVMS